MAINKKIYQGHNLDQDRLLLESRLEYCQDSLHFSNEDQDWVSWEGKPYKNFLHLEDNINVNPLQTLFDKNGEEVSGTENVLEVLHDFYCIL